MASWSSYGLRIDGESRAKTSGHSAATSSRVNFSSSSRHETVDNFGSENVDNHDDMQGTKGGVILYANSAGDEHLLVNRSPEQRATNPDRLNLDRRNLIVCPILQNEEQLRLLNYQHNLLKCIENLSGLRRLIFLDLYDNKIEKIDNLDSLLSLRVLMLGKNKIQKIQNLDRLGKLDVLDLHANEICCIENLNHLAELRVLNLAGNRIVEVKGLRGMASLAELNLRRNHIQTMSDLEFTPNLQRLFLSFNDLSRFDEMSCLTYAVSLTELTLDNNPISDEPRYRQMIILHVSQLRQLDMKRIIDEERRVAFVMAKKDEERSRARQRAVNLQEKRKLAARNAKRQWELMRKATIGVSKEAVRAMHASATDSRLFELGASSNLPSVYGEKTNSTLRDLHATHVGSYLSTGSVVVMPPSGSQSNKTPTGTDTSAISSPDFAFGGSDVAASLSQSSLKPSSRPPSGRKSAGSSCQSSRPTSALSNAGRPQQQSSRPASVSTSGIESLESNRATKCSSPASENVVVGASGVIGESHIAEIRGTDLCLFGPRSLETVERSWGTHAASTVTAALFSFADFTDIALCLHKLKSRFPNIVSVSLESCNVTTLQQINLLGVFKQLDSLNISTEGNPVTALNLFRPYTIFRLGTLKTLNDQNISTHERTKTMDLFSGLSSEILGSISPIRLQCFIGDLAKPVIERKLDKMSAENISRQCLSQHFIVQPSDMHKKLAHALIAEQLYEACELDRKMKHLDVVLPKVIARLFCEAMKKLTEPNSSQKITDECEKQLTVFASSANTSSR